MQRPIQQRRVQHETPNPTPPPLLLLRQHHLREQLIPTTPRSTQPPKSRPVLQTPFSESVIQTIDIDRLRAHRRPLARNPATACPSNETEPAGASKPSSMTRPPRLDTQPSSPDPSGREYIPTSRQPSSSGSPTFTCNRTPPCSPKTSGAFNVNSRTHPHSTSPPARNANSKNAVPGNNTTPPTHDQRAKDGTATRSAP